jgi:hypothetical protein
VHIFLLGIKYEWSNLQELGHGIIGFAYLSRRVKPTSRHVEQVQPRLLSSHILPLQVLDVTLNLVQDGLGTLTTYTTGHGVGLFTSF